MQGLIFANIAAAAATVLILFLRRIFKDKMFAKVFVLLWALVILRLLLPFEFSSAISLYSAPAAEQSAPAEYNVQIPWEAAGTQTAAPANTESPTKTKAKISSAQMLFALWAFGAAFTGGCFALRHYCAVKKLTANSILLGDIPEEFTDSNIRIYKNKSLASPLSFGLLNPCIVIPEDTLPEQLPFVLLHERIHIKGRDAALKLLAAFALSLNWFDPFAWLAVKYLDRDLERYCDERVLAALGGENSARYANVILDFAEKESLSLNFFSAASLEERVISIMKNKTKRRHLPAALCVFAAVLLVMTACGTSPAPEESAVSSPENSSYDERILYLYPTSGQNMCYEGDELFRTFSSQGGYMYAELKSTHICSSAEGTVSEAVENSEGLGNYVVIDHPDGNKTLYAFCGKLLVTEGQKVSAGEKISFFATENPLGTLKIKCVYFQILGEGGFDYKDYVSAASNLSYTPNEDAAEEERAALEEELIDIQTGEAVSEGEITEGTVAEGIDKSLQNILKFVWPCEGTTVTADMTSYHGHNGIDIGPGRGLEVYAAAEGTVVTVSYTQTGYGYHIIVNHGNGIQTLYAHCSELYVEVGQLVEAGELIALTGSTGNSTGNHLHFEFRINGEYVDPLEYIEP